MCEIRLVSGWWNYRWVLIATFLVTASLLPAQDRGRFTQARVLFQWKGRVEREIRISMRGREAWTQSSFRTVDGRNQPVVLRALPREEGWVYVRMENGRGDVDVVQQPTRRNDYTAVIRVRDGGNGSDIYRVTAYWDDANDDYGRNGRPRDDRGFPGRDDGWGRGDDGWGRGNDRWDRTVLRWSGRVDDALEIRIRDGRIEYRNISGKGTRDVRAELTRADLLREGVNLQLRTWTARGDIALVQQPTARNGYTTVIRIDDPRPSYGFYDFELSLRGRFTARR